jgi:hypothetical protein
MAIPDFSRLDLTLLMLTYARVECLAPQLRRLEEQSFDGRCELVLWNNNPAITRQVQEIARTLRRFPVTVIASDTNYIGQARCAVTQLARGRLFMLCDDDVMPGKNFLQGFVDALARYGPRVVVCGSGHQLSDPTVEDLTATSAKHLDLSDADAYVDYAHGSTLLTSTALYREASMVPMPRLEYILADDLWLSHVWSSRLHVPLVKIRCDAVWHASSGDPRIALHKNALVAREQASILRDHMRGHLLARAPRTLPEAPKELAVEPQTLQRAHQGLIQGSRLRRGAT